MERIPSIPLRNPYECVSALVFACVCVLKWENVSYSHSSKQPCFPESNWILADYNICQVQVLTTGWHWYICYNGIQILNVACGMLKHNLSTCDVNEHCCSNKFKVTLIWIKANIENTCSPGSKKLKQMTSFSKLMAFVLGQWDNAHYWLFVKPLMGITIHQSCDNWKKQSKKKERKYLSWLLLLQENVSVYTALMAKAA